MAEMMWEKPLALTAAKPKASGLKLERLKFLVGGALLLGAVVYLVLSGTMTGARFFITVEDVVSNPEYIGQTVRITGVVLGDSIAYDARTGELQFTIAHLPNTDGDLGMALHLAAKDPNATRLKIYMEDETMPDLLQHEAQAILTGALGEDGVFHANELLLKCPSRFQEIQPSDIADAGA